MIKISELEAKDRKDIEDRWQQWFDESQLKGIDQEATRKKAFEGIPDIEARLADAGITIEELESSVTGSPNAILNPMIGHILEAMTTKLPEVSKMLDSIPILVLPTLKYEAFGNRLMSGLPYIGMSMMMLLYPSLVAKLMNDAAAAALEKDQVKLFEAMNGLTLQSWHLNSGNHELSGYLALRTKLDPESDKAVFQIAMSMIAFVVLHELAHIKLGLQPTNDKAKIHLQEFEADDQATQWWVALFSPREHWDHPALGISSLFQFFAMTDDLYGSNPERYPTWGERYARVRSRLSLFDIPEQFLVFAEGLYAVAGDRARRTTLVARDNDGTLQTYANPKATMDIVNALTLGFGEMIILIIGPDGTLHEKIIDAEAIEAHQKSKTRPARLRH